MQVITANDIKIVPQEMSVAGIIKAVAVNPEEQNTGQNALYFIFRRWKIRNSLSVGQGI